MNEFDTGRAARSRPFGRVAAALLFAASLAAARAEFTLDDIHFWVGEGTNRAAVVGDWNAEGAAPLVWGYRWNGEPIPVRDAIEAIAREDNRLVYASSVSQLGTSVDGFGYDRSDVAAAFDLANGTATDPDALVGVYAGSLYWAQSPGTGDSFESCAWTYGSGVDYDLLSDGGWYALKLVNWETGESTEPTGPVAAAESPYAWRVAAADVAGGSGYGNPANALGGPSRSVPGWGDIPPTTVNPVSPAWAADQLVTLASATDGETGGSITVEFDHGILDDPRNPFGLDFIVFGNAMQVLGGDAWFDGVSDPAGVVVSTAELIPERGLVEVSADGETWFAFADGPYADDFAPTLSHRYDPENPDRSLFGDSAYTNEWWGAPTDATRPVDPAAGPGDFKGRTLAEIAQLYDGSAGGTGFDISGFDLPRDGLGRKYVRFVRITSLDPYDTTEVDAVADVAPAVSFRNWVDANYPFDQRPGVAKTNLCANGAPAYANAAFGFAPDAEWPAGWEVGGFDPATRTLAAPFSPYATDLVFLQSVTSLTAGEWPDFLPLWVGTDDLGRPLLQVQDSTDARAFFRLKVHD